MRAIGFVESRRGEKEILPRTYGVETLEARRRMFFTLINESLSSAAKFSLEKEGLFRHTLHAIFKERICSFFQMHRLRPERAQRIKCIYACESQLFNQFFKQERDGKSRYMTRQVRFNPNFVMLTGYRHPVAELITMIFDGRNVGLTLDLDRLFTQTVFRRIKRENGKKVTLDTPYIHIDSHGVRTRLYPRWKRLDPGNERTRTKTLREGARQLSETDVDQCYLLYPKTEKFRRHIEVNSAMQGHLKVVPYSFTFCNRSSGCSGKCTKNRARREKHDRSIQHSKEVARDNTD